VTKKTTTARKKNAGTPRRDRPRFPTGYLETTSARGMVPWARADALLERAAGYWLSTTNEDGRPHLVQQWAVWTAGALHFGGSPQTRWSRNLSREARAAMSVERGTEIVILEGRCAVVRPDPALARTLAAGFARKYGRVYKYRPTPELMAEGLWRFTPRVAYAWDVRTFGRSPTRFRFGVEET
jgi:hypothetical protein